MISRNELLAKIAKADEPHIERLDKEIERRLVMEYEPGEPLEIPVDNYIRRVVNKVAEKYRLGDWAVDVKPADVVGDAWTLIFSKPPTFQKD